MKLSVIEVLEKDSSGNKLARCLCECGNETVTRLTRALSGETKSCGCYRSKAHTTHGGSKDRRYSIACDIYKRCYNKNNTFYNRYGGRGIICPENVGEIYKMLLLVDGYFEGAEIDRADNDGNYEIKNLRWVTRTENMNNTSRSRSDTDYETIKITRTNFKRFCLRLGLNFNHYEEIYCGVKIGRNKVYNYKKIELKTAKEAK